MKPLTYAPEARAELLDAIRYYNRQRSGLGEEFRLEFIRVRELVVAKSLALRAGSTRASESPDATLSLQTGVSDSPA
jgi:hypothetical protein